MQPTRKERLARYEAIARRVGLELGRPLAGTVAKFAACLEVCISWYGDAEKYHHGSPRHDFNEFVAEVADAADGLLTLLTDPRVNGLIPFLPKNNLTIELQSILPSLKRFRLLGPGSTPATGLEVDLVEGMQYEDQFKQRSPFEWIAGVYLPELFYLFYDNTRWGKGKEFLLFAGIILQELKIRSNGRKYSPNSIARAVRLGRALPGKDGFLRRKYGSAFDVGVSDPLEWYRHQHFAHACGFRAKTPIEAVARMLREPIKERGQ
jgi:hypothetical protein